MNWYRIAKTKSKNEEKDYSWTYVNIPNTISRQTLAFAEKIPSRELFTDDNHPEWSYGIESEQHITLLWGIHTIDVRKIKKALNGQKGGNIFLGQIGMFESKDYDVLKVNIISPALHRLNKTLKNNIKYTNTYSDYHPHITLAYLKAGNGEKYINNKKFQGLKYDFNKIVFEDYNDKATTIELN